MKKIMLGVFVSAVMLVQTVPVLPAGTSGGIILTQAVGARAQGMGEVFTGVADDVTTLFWNVGGLSRAKGFQVNATYLTGLADSTYEQITGTYQAGKLGTFGLGVNLLQGGMITLDNADGSTSDVQSQSDFAISAGFGTAINKKLGVGLGLKMLSSTLAEEVSATAFALDLGMLLAVSKQLSIGLVLQNAGTEIKYQDEGDPLPLTARLGAGYQVPISKQHKGLLAVDLVKSNDNDFGLHMGVEYWYAKLLAMRLGYKAGYDLEGLTAGFGVRFNVLQLDYAFGLISELNHTHKVSLSLVL